MLSECQMHGVIAAKQVVADRYGGFKGTGDCKEPQHDCKSIDDRFVVFLQGLIKAGHGSPLLWFWLCCNNLLFNDSKGGELRRHNRHRYDYHSFRPGISSGFPGRYFH